MPEHREAYSPITLGRWSAPAATAALSAVLAAAPSAACQGGGTECQCDPQGFTVTLDPGAGDAQVVASGEACTGADVVCETPTASGGCAGFRVIPNASGNCHIDVYLSGGTSDSDDVNIVHAAGCCSGFYADPPSSGDVDLPAIVDAAANLEASSLEAGSLKDGSLKDGRLEDGGPDV